MSGGATIHWRYAGDALCGRDGKTSAAGSRVTCPECRAEAERRWSPDTLILRARAAGFMAQAVRTEQFAFEAFMAVFHPEFREAHPDRYRNAVHEIGARRP